MRRTVLALSAAALALAGAAAAAPAASANINCDLCVPAVGVVASPSPSGTSMTTFRMDYNTWRAMSRAGVGFYGGDPAGGTLVSPGRPAMEMPVKAFMGGVATHDGDLTFLRADSMYFRTVVLDNVTFDFNKKKVTARVYASDTDLGKKALFSLSHVKVDSGMYNFTLKLTPDGAATLNSSLNVTVFSAGQRVAAGMTMSMPMSGS
ncbi:MAG: hypothetical protein ACR2KE_02580 [Candidatus Nanopelagicales bacterium]